MPKFLTRKTSTFLHILPVRETDVQGSQDTCSWPGAAAAAIGAELLRESSVACLLVLICSGWLEEHC